MRDGPPPGQSRLLNHWMLMARKNPLRCEREKLHTDALLDLFIKVCQAIQHAHQKGVIHPDISQMLTLWDTESFESVLTLPGQEWLV